ncbi:MAG: ChbG/HpnK family deacetylase, partial [Candidatus Omnitrophica bacterium]|nr:ChbG/HpnK family deacetylase [Candidatus Omnitrophota bacterium]
RKTFGNKIKMHSAEYIADLMEKLSKDFGIKGVIFEDDNFMLSESRLLKLATLIKKRKIKIAWSALSRVDTINAQKLKIAKSSGCWQILYGIESGSQEMLEFYKKGILLRQIQEAICLTKKHGIFTKGLFIIGGPTETIATLRQTRDLIMRLPFHDVSLTFFTPYPGADIWKKMQEFKGSLEKDWDRFTCFDPVYTPSGLSKDEVINSQTDILKEFYAQPRVVFSYLKRLSSLPQLKEFFASWYSLRLYAKNKKQKKTLIMNADDFGLCTGINNGILQGIRNGTIGSVSLMPNGFAFDQAAKILKDNPNIKVGVHLSVKKFILAEKSFFSFLLDYFFCGLKRKEILEEFSSEIEKLKNAGLSIHHLDSHQHIHLLPGIFRITIQLAKKYQVPFIRLPAVPIKAWFVSRKAPLSKKLLQIAINFICFIYKPVLRMARINFYDYSFGFLESGKLTEEAIERILSSPGNGSYELFCHPAQEDAELKKIIGHWGYHWNEELRILASNNIKEAASQLNIKLG